MSQATSTTQLTCSQCRSFKDGFCQVRVAADWENSQVRADKPVCNLAELATS